MSGIFFWLKDILRISCIQEMSVFQVQWFMPHIHVVIHSCCWEEHIYGMLHQYNGTFVSLIDFASDEVL